MLFNSKLYFFLILSTFSFQSKADRCSAFVRNEAICSWFSNLESSEYFRVEAYLSCHSTTWSVNFSPNCIAYHKFFYYPTSKIEHILPSFAIILGDFDGHHRQWHSSCFQDLAINFSLYNNLEKMVKFPNRISDHLGNESKIFNPNSSPHTVKLLPLGSSDHVIYSFSSDSLSLPHVKLLPTKRKYFRYFHAVNCIGFSVMLL